MAGKGLRARTVVLKLRYSDFRTVTRQNSRPQPVDGAEEVRMRAEALLDATAGPEDRFRLLGIHCTNLTTGGEDGGQLALW